MRSSLTGITTRVRPKFSIWFQTPEEHHTDSFHRHKHSNLTNPLDILTITRSFSLVIAAVIAVGAVTTTSLVLSLPAGARLTEPIPRAVFTTAIAPRGAPNTKE